MYHDGAQVKKSPASHQMPRREGEGGTYDGPQKAHQRNQHHRVGWLAALRCRGTSWRGSCRGGRRSLSLWRGARLGRWRGGCWRGGCWRGGRSRGRLLRAPLGMLAPLAATQLGTRGLDVASGRTHGCCAPVGRCRCRTGPRGGLATLGLPRCFHCDVGYPRAADERSRLWTPSELGRLARILREARRHALVLGNRCWRGLVAWRRISAQGRPQRAASEGLLHAALGHDPIVRRDGSRGHRRAPWTRRIRRVVACPGYNGRHKSGCGCRRRHR